MPAYPAIPTTKQVYIRICTHIHSSVVYREPSLSVLDCLRVPQARGRPASERQAHAGTRPMRPAMETGSQDNADTNTELRIEAAHQLDFESSSCPTPSRRRLSPAARRCPIIHSSSTRPCDLVSCPVRPSPCPTTAPAGHRHLGEFVIGIIQVRFNLCSLAFKKIHVYFNC
jgi:hypothetical protein